MASSKKAVKDIIQEELAKQKVVADFLENSEELIPAKPSAKEHEFGTEKISDEEKVIDELLASVPRNQGYYLKLYKELRPNDWELKLRIDSFEQWSDLEWEVANLVRSYTLKAPNRWGTARYRVVIWRDGGLRGPKFKPIDFWVDAGEVDAPHQQSQLDQVTESEKVKDQLQTLSDLMRVIKEANPSVSPADIQKLLADSFKTGIEINAAKSNNESAQNNTMMTLVTTLLSEIIKGKNENSSGGGLSDLVNTLLKEVIEKRDGKSPLALLKELREAGIINQPSQPATPADPMETVRKQFEFMGTLLPLIQSLTGAGRSGESGVAVELIRSVGPQLKDIVKDITSSINKLAESRINQPVMRPRLSQPQQPITENPPDQPPTIDKVEESIQPEVVNPPTESTNGIPEMLKPLKNAIESRNHKYFPDLEELLIKIGNQTYYDLLDKKVTLEDVLAQVRTVAGDWVVSQQALIYFNEFLNWARTKRANEVPAKCPNCQEEYIYDNKEIFDANSLCENCGSQLEVVNLHQPLG